MNVLNDCVCAHVGYCDGSCTFSENEMKESDFIQGFHTGMLEAARTLREAANEHKAQAQTSKKILDAQANELAAAILYGWANGLEINAQKALK